MRSFWSSSTSDFDVSESSGNILALRNFALAFGGRLHLGVNTSNHRRDQKTTWRRPSHWLPHCVHWQSRWTRYVAHITLFSKCSSLFSCTEIIQGSTTASILQNNLCKFFCLNYRVPPERAYHTIFRWGEFITRPLTHFNIRHLASRFVAD